jgi:serine/threonine protein kinase
MTFITTWKPGQTIKNGRFEILQVLGRGGFGITYLAQDMKNGQKLAIKTLNDHHQRGKDFCELQEKFLNKNMKLYSLRHPNIVRVYELIQEGELWGIVKEYIEGQNLDDWLIEREKLTEVDALDYIDRIAQPLEYIHQQGFLHLDLKPNNMMREEGTGRIVLMDLGEPEYNTPTYAAIEKLEQRYDEIGTHTDIYSLAATLYYLTGNYPSDARIYKHIAPKPPQELNPAISDRVSQAILTAMETDIKKRPQNIHEFRQLLGLV